MIVTCLVQLVETSRIFENIFYMSKVATIHTRGAGFRSRYAEASNLVFLFRRLQRRPVKTITPVGTTLQCSRYGSIGSHILDSSLGLERWSGGQPTLSSVAAT